MSTTIYIHVKAYVQTKTSGIPLSMYMSIRRHTRVNNYTNTSQRLHTKQHNRDPTTYKHVNNYIHNYISGIPLMAASGQAAAAAQSVRLAPPRLLPPAELVSNWHAQSAVLKNDMTSHALKMNSYDTNVKTNNAAEDAVSHRLTSFSEVCGVCGCVCLCGCVCVYVCTCEVIRYERGDQYCCRKCCLASPDLLF